MRSEEGGLSLFEIVGIGGTVTLPNPEFGDDWTPDLMTAVNRTLDGSYKGVVIELPFSSFNLLLIHPPP